MSPDREPTAALAYDREVLTAVVIYHYRKGIEGCGCGWAELGASYAEHVADVYEQSVAVKAAVARDVG
jgi:hypothetical protein